MFRFTIRDFLWLTALLAVILALGTGWWRDRAKLIQAQDQARYEAEMNRKIAQDMLKAMQAQAEPNASKKPL
jgi:hypothetical protein